MCNSAVIVNWWIVKPLVLSDYSAISSVGKGVAALEEALWNEKTGLAPLKVEFAKDIQTHAGWIKGLDQPTTEGRFDSRSNRLVQACLTQDGFEKTVFKAIDKYGPDRISLVIGTSTSGLLETEYGYMSPSLEDESVIDHFREKLYYTHCFYSAVDYVSGYFDLTGPAFALSTACSSSAKAFAAAARHIEAGFADAAVVGGVDTLCMTTLYGFTSLNVVSPTPCKPCDKDRDGLSLGEAAGFVLLEKPENVENADKEVWLSGYGESSDAYHMSSPHPEGAGAEMAMRKALKMSESSANDIDYINMHGTATIANDLIEARAITRIFGSTPCSSTKGWTGHALGAAGVLEAIISAICIRAGMIPGCLNLKELDPDIKCNVAGSTTRADVSRVLVNSFGFGGNNCSLVLELGR